MTILPVHPCIESPYRWMDQKPSVRAEAALQRCEQMEPLVRAETERMRDENFASHSVAVGRIVSESVEAENDPKLPFNLHSVLLETSTASGPNNTRKIFRIRLHLSECPEYILFLGQIVGAIGTIGPSGKEMYVERLVCGASVLPCDAQLRGASLTTPTYVTVASGPYSPENMLLFDSIGELEARIRTSKNPPDLLLLLGPFLDINNPIVASGTVPDSFDRPASFDDIYRDEIVPKLARLARTCETSKTELIIVPSANEAGYLAPIPQPSWTSFATKFKDQIPPHLVKFTSNPTTLLIGDLKMVVTSADALSAINCNVLFKQGIEQPDSQPLGRVDACLDQIIRCRSLFPVMPCGMRIDPVRRHLTDFKQVPDIIISPSCGKRFIKNIRNRVFVNPGFMSDPSGAHMHIAEFTVHPGSAQTNSDVCSRITGEIVQLGK